MKSSFTYLGTSFPHALETNTNPETALWAAVAIVAGDPTLQAWK